ncbi:transcription initiation factor TFIID subunit 4-like isoform X2 [Chelonus insularis]|uniref:transcription initiation factor TFIID subunit 4-like isoform X2 n=1 Tax=Chelonus insularis TaxID=460826 RepID=UPI00158B487D|nr:transcription initiation factor TFIID subunit 4-like isoform X2 [Chelonus insularis]
MASAKFLEEALSTDVDESAVNAIVGSLETQLVTSTPAASGHQAITAVVSQQNHQLNSGISNGGTIPTAIQKHGVANGGGTTSVNSLMTQEVTKSIATTTLVPVNIVTSNAVTSQVVVTSQPHIQAGGGIPVTSYINQGAANQSTIPNLAKTHESVKIIYPTAGQVIATTGVVNVNTKLSFPAQTVGQLANGTLGVSSQPVLQTTSNVTNVGSVTQTSGQQVTSVNKPTGTALVIKTSGTPGGMVSVPMSVPVSVAGNVANTTLQAKPGVQSTIVPSNVQILNVNPMRPSTPVGGQQAGKQVAPRVLIGQHLVGARPGGPGITLHGLQPGAQGHLIVKTENGHYQLLRVGPAPVAAPGSTTVNPNNITGNVVAPAAGTTFRVASVPATVATTVSTTTVTPSPTSTAATTTATPQATSVSTAQRQTADNTKEKCRKFLANLLELSSREPKAVERNVRTLIQELIDTKVEPEEFCDRLEKLLNASPQPCLIGFLKKSLPLLRQSLVTQELIIDGIKPPPANVVFSIQSGVSPILSNQIRPTVAVAASAVPTVVSSSSTPVRIMPPPPTTTTISPRASQTVPPRLVRPVTTIVRTPVAHTVKSSVAVTGMRPSAPTVQKSPIVATTIVKTITTTMQGKTLNTATTVNKTIVPSLVSKSTTKEKEKKTFSSAGYTGDDDINDVAAMGGVNLAEESQRILGSTEFVGTQIRSCKDEIFLHLAPLQQRIKQIVSSYGLEEPNHEVAALISHATQERLKNLVEKLAVIAEHRIDLIKVDPRYEVTQDVRSQLKFLEELDRAERRRHEEQEREILLKAAKSRAKTEDPEQAKLKQKAKEMQRAEMEELRTREANLTALQAIGPRKKPRLDTTSTNNSGNSNLNASASGLNRQIPLRPRLKRVNFRDLLFLLEQEKELCRSTMLYKAYLK